MSPSPPRNEAATTLPFNAALKRNTKGTLALRFECAWLQSLRMFVVHSFRGESSPLRCRRNESCAAAPVASDATQQIGSSGFQRPRSAALPAPVPASHPVPVPDRQFAAFRLSFSFLVFAGGEISDSWFAGICETRGEMETKCSSGLGIYSVYMATRHCGVHVNVRARRCYPELSSHVVLRSESANSTPTLVTFCYIFIFYRYLEANSYQSSIPQRRTPFRCSYLDDVFKG